MFKTVVVIDNNATAAGGTAQVAIASAVALSKQGKRVIFFAGPDGVCPQLRESNIEVHTVGTYGINSDPNKARAAINGIWHVQIARELKKLLASLDRDNTIVHIHGYIHYLSGSIFRVCKVMRFRTVLTLHDYFTVCPCGGFYDYGAKRICERKPMSLRCVVSNCDKRSYFQKIWRMARQVIIDYYVRRNRSLSFIYISQLSYGKMKAYLKGQKAYYVRNPYDLGDESIYEAEQNTDYLYVGRLSDEKGIDIFCEAMAAMIDSGKIRGQALVIGEGYCREKYQKLYPQISFLGWKTHDEIQQYISRARALIFPSRWYEGAPLTPVEFMSHGIPCISSDCCAAIEYIKDTENGLLFKHEDVESLKEAVLKAEDDSVWVEIAERLRGMFVREEYSVEMHVKALLRVYELI